MGRKPWSNRRLVEDCRALSIATLVRSGFFSPWIDSNGYRHELSRTLTWTSGFAVCVTYPGRCVGGDLRPPSPRNEEVKLTYDTTRSKIEESIEIVSTGSPARHSAKRFYFLCPGWDDAPCQKRVGKLYLPLGEDFFRCRACHDLTYRSVKEHDKRIDALRQALRGSDPRWALLALRAVPPRAWGAVNPNRRFSSLK
jgi:hypothetical protein